MKIIIIFLFFLLILSGCNKDNIDTSRETIRANSGVTNDILNYTDNNDTIGLKEYFNKNKVNSIDLNPDCPSNTICKPITIATQKNNIEIIDLLIKNGANIDGKTGGSGDTPLIIAIINDNDELIKYFVKNGANVNQMNNFGMSAFGGVCMMGKTNLVKLFLENGALINSKLKYRGVKDITPLMLAIDNNQLEIAKLLIESGADINLLDSNGLSSIDYAKKTNDPDLINLLK